MSILDKHINQGANHLKDTYEFSIPVAPVASQTNAVFGRWSPLFPFLVIGVRLYGTTFTNVTSIDFGLAPTAGGTFATCLTGQITPSADAEVAGVLVATLATLRGTSTSQMIVRYTTGTGPAAVNAYISVAFRVRPANREAQ